MIAAGAAAAGDRDSRARFPSGISEAAMRAQLSTIERRAIPGVIRTLRGRNVILDAEIAALYGVETRALLQAVRRNAKRFPDDFMFRLSRREADDLTSQSVISRSGGGRRYPPYAFTEQGVAMLSSVLRSEQAARVNVEIIAGIRAVTTAPGNQSRLGAPPRRARAAI